MFKENVRKLLNELRSDIIRSALFTYLQYKVVFKYVWYSEVSIVLNFVFWISIIILPIVLYSGITIKAAAMYVPGCFVYFVLSSMMWIGAGLLRHGVREGVLYFYWECGLKMRNLAVGYIFRELVTAILAYVVLIVFIYAYTGVLLLPKLDPLLVPLFVLTLFASAYLVFALTQLLYTKVKIPTGWVNIVQFVLVIGTIAPPRVFGSQGFLVVINPGTVPATILRYLTGFREWSYVDLIVISVLHLIAVMTIALFLFRCLERELKKQIPELLI